MRTVREQRRLRAPLLFLALLFCLRVPLAAADCPPILDNVASAVVAQVIDGDTVALRDGRRVRIIGINAPEVARDGKPGEPGAMAATRALEAALAGGQVGLVVGVEARDRYGRLLAHLVNERGDLIAADLLRQGVVHRLTIPPNTRFVACLDRAEVQAREAGRGLWRHARWQPVRAEALDGASRGYRLVIGKVTRVNRGGGAWWLNLGPEVALRVPESDWPLFEEAAFAALIGREVFARGWGGRRKGEYRLSVRHPLDLRDLASMRPCCAAKTRQNGANVDD